MDNLRTLIKGNDSVRVEAGSEAELRWKERGYRDVTPVAEPEQPGPEEPSEPEPPVAEADIVENWDEAPLGPLDSLEEMKGY